ncbi:MAG: hypothetical protein S4CHLAM37_11180 [Chlamydiia bacterium]|nr:hypothetical protein [Chlamydiia bacterium]
MRQPRQKEAILTNEALASLFCDNFQLAITAIKLAQNEVKAGHEVTMQSTLAQLKQNPHLYTFENRSMTHETESHE